MFVSPSVQALYEAGYITYMRTDRPTLSKEAAGVAERAVRDSFGDDYVRKGERRTRGWRSVDQWCYMREMKCAVSGSSVFFLREVLEARRVQK